MKDNKANAAANSRSAAQHMSGRRGAAMNAVQRMCNDCEEEESKGSEPEGPPSQMKADPSAPVQRDADNRTGLPSEVKSKMETSMGSDFSGVRVHTNSQSATDVGAKAYTQGSDVHFAPGQFKPETTSGQELIGHELTHVVQQSENRVTANTSVNGMPVNDNPSLEREADNMGKKAARS